MMIYKRTFEEFEKKFMGFTVLVVLGQSCLGSAAAMYVLKNGTSARQMLQLAMVVLVCMAVNASVLSVQKPKVVFNMTLLSVFLSIFFIILNTLIL